jgi:hypothetical protein
MVLVNCFIVYNLALKKKGAPPMDHNTFFRQMQAALIEVTAEDFTHGLTRNTAPARFAGMASAAAAHDLVEESNDVRIVGNNVKQKRQRVCKVCSILKVSRGTR